MVLLELEKELVIENILEKIILDLKMKIKLKKIKSVIIVQLLKNLIKEEKQLVN